MPKFDSALVRIKLLVFKFNITINDASIIITIKIGEQQDERSLHGNIHCKKGTVSFKYTEYFRSFDSFLYYLDYGETSKKYNRGAL